jgi:CRP-like cAMP-binding protein
MNGNSSNRILSSLTPADYRAIQPHLRTVQLEHRRVLNEANEEIQSILFPLDCMISVIASTSAGDTTELGLIANDGFDGGAALMGPNTLPYRSLVQVEGSAVKVGIEIVKNLFQRSSSFRHVVLGYMYLMFSQLAQSAVCNRFHSVEQRLSRWMLTSMDHTGRRMFPYTHEMLGAMLGTRRATVTMVIGEFERAGMVDAQRGSVTIVSPEKLLKVTCECYFAFLKQIDLYFDSFSLEGIVS